jgi:benzoyl-CoA reductase/2-hydroxyglutaryl-CoA dehydratase subunit BcrC/BadD/HgdB
MNNLKKKLSDQVSELAQTDFALNDVELFDMTADMQQIYLWALQNAPIRQLREWKKEFKQRHKEQEEQEDE